MSLGEANRMSLKLARLVFKQLTDKDSYYPETASEGRLRPPIPRCSEGDAGSLCDPLGGHTGNRNSPKERIPLVRLIRTLGMANKFKSKKSSEERQAEVKGLLETLKQGVSDLISTEAWTNYLAFQSKFHAYSFSNTMLIHMQCKTATQVAGFQTWKKMKRFVRKGEKGIRILAPAGLVNFEKKAPDGDVKKHSFMRFKTVSVFDVSQTDGEAVPAQPEDVTRLQGGDEGLIARLVEFTKFRGGTVTFKAIEGEANGYCYPTQKAITVDSNLSPAQQAKTLAHEIGHMLLHAGCQDLMSREDKELEAESVAYIVCNAFGLETAEYSLGYISYWAGKSADKGFKASAERIVKASQEVIDALEKAARLEKFMQAA